MQPLHYVKIVYFLVLLLRIFLQVIAFQVLAMPIVAHIGNYP